jgi:hypothetical protein
MTPPGGTLQKLPTMARRDAVLASEIGEWRHLPAQTVGVDPPVHRFGFGARRRFKQGRQSGPILVARHRDLERDNLPSGDARKLRSKIEAAACESSISVPHDLHLGINA